MGLEVVELVMALEDEFDIEIPEKDLEEMSTVGHLVDYFAARVAPTDVPSSGDTGERGWCRTQQAFYWVRGMAQAQVDARNMRPSDLLAGRLTPREWLTLRMSISSVTGLKLPDARRGFLGWPVGLPADVPTFGDLARRIAQSGRTVYGTRPPLGPDPQTHREAVRCRVVDVFVREVQVPAHLVTDDARVVEDLHLD